MKKVSSIIILFLCGLSCKETKQDYSASQIPEVATVSDYSHFDGLKKASVIVDSITVAEGDFLNNLHHGTWTEYDTQGKIKSVSSYLQGKKQGVELQFDKRGIKTKAYYVNDLLNGEFLVYNFSRITEKKSYKNGKLNGFLTKFYSSGKKMEESIYVDGILDGVAKWYNKEGELTIEYTYDMGSLVK